MSTSGIGNVVTYHWGAPEIVNAGKSNTSGRAEAPRRAYNRGP